MSEPAAFPGSSLTTDDPKSAQLLIVGLGNPMMADDGIGHEVVSRLEQRGLPNGVRLVSFEGDMLTLMNRWRGESAVWLVDAVSSNQPAGSLCVCEHRELLQLSAGGLSTHQPSVSENLRWMLHARPEFAAAEFRLFGIEAGFVRPGKRFSGAVESAVDRLVDLVWRAAWERAAFSSGNSPDLRECRDDPTSF
jgi:hydrogenase maturation protease